MNQTVIRKNNLKYSRILAYTYFKRSDTIKTKNYKLLHFLNEIAVTSILKTNLLLKYVNRIQFGYTTLASDKQSVDSTDAKIQNGLE